MDAEMDDDTPNDLDELRLRMARRVANFNAGWKRCTARPCRRARRCIDAALMCKPDRPPVPRGDDVRMMAELRAALTERLALLDGE